MYIVRATLTLMFPLICATVASAQTDPIHGERPDALVIRNVTYVDGAGVPARGPATILIQDGHIESILGATAPIPTIDGDVRIIDGTGKYALPGFINMHAHLHGPWGISAFPLQYIYDLWLACGITTVRDVGSMAPILLEERERSAKGEIAAPRMFAYLWFPTGSVTGGLNKAELFTEDWLRKEVRRLKGMGADGLKLRHFDRETVAIVMDEANEQQLPIAHHVGVESMDALDNARFGTTTIEHWYGIPEAAILGPQNFPSDFTYANELLRFRYSGRVWREADSDRLENVLNNLVKRQSRLEPHICDLRSRARFAARAHPTRVSRLPPPRDGTLFHAPTRPNTVPSSLAGPTPTKSTGAKTSASGWTRSSGSATSAASSPRAKTRASFTNSSASATSANCNSTKKPASTPSKSSNTPLTTAQKRWAKSTNSVASAPATSRMS